MQKLKAISALLMHEIAQTFSLLLATEGELRKRRQILPRVDGKADKKEKIETSKPQEQKKGSKQGFAFMFPRPKEKKGGDEKG